MIWSKCPKRVYVAKADLLFLVVNEMKGNSYLPGGFSTKIIPMLILQAMDQFPKYKQDVCKTITFVSNVDVQAFITLS